MKNLVLIACAFALAMLPADRAQAQATTASVTGIATNASGAPVPNLSVTIENETTGQRMTATTDEQGRYRFDSLPAGRYRFVTATGQATAAPSREFDVRAGQTNTINVNVSGAPGTPSTDGIVTAQPVTLNPMPAQVMADYNTLYSYAMPQSNLMLPNGQVFGATNLTTLNPGVTAGGIGQGSGPAVAGERPYFNEWRIDGIDNNNKVRLGTPMMYVSNQATNEMTLFQNQFDPVFGHDMGGKGNLFSSTGTNQFHGQLYDFLQNRNLNAVNQNMANLGIRDNPRYDQNRLGGSVGFPIVPSKIFVYGNFEYLPFGVDRVAGYALAPTASGFSTLAGMPGISSTNLGILQQATGNGATTATGSTIISGQTIPLGPVNTLTQAWQNSYMGNGAVDFTPWKHDSLHVRFVDNRIIGNNMASVLPTIPTGTSNYALMASAAETHNFSSAVTNELRFGYNRWSNLLNVPSSFAGLNGGIPSINIGGSADGLFIAPPQEATNALLNTYHLNDTIGVTWRTHNVKLGFDGLRIIGFQSGFPGSAGTYGYSDLGAFLLDQSPDVAALRSFGSNRFEQNQTLLFGFLQDSWRVHPSFTLNLGLRYEYDTIPAGFAAQGLNANANVPGGLQFGSPHLDNHMFAPNVGFAWSPNRQFMNRTFVVRGGFGMYYAGLFSNSIEPGAPFGSLGAPFVPGITTVQGNLNSTTSNFLGAGGIPAPANLNASNLTPGQSRALTSSYIGKQVLPYSMNWNFGVETDLWHSATLDLRYLGTRVVHLPVFQDLNAPAALTTGLPVFNTTPTQANLNSLTTTLSSLQTSQTRPLASLGFAGPLYTFAPDGNSWYNGATVRLTQHFAGGVQMIGAYTFSHLYDDSMGNWVDLLSPTRTKASSLYDRRHRLTISGVVDVAPMFKNTYSVVRNIVANMQLSGTYTYQSPQYLPILSSGAGGFLNGVLVNPSGNGLFTSSLSPLHNTGGQVVGYLNSNPGASITAGAPGVVGSPLRAAFPLDPTNNFDLALVKGFSYHDRIGFQIRGDAYNLFNHPQFTGGPINSVAYGSLGTFLPSFLNAGSAAFNQPQLFMGSNARMLDVALRITF